MSTESPDLANKYDFSVIRTAVEKIQRGAESGLNGHLTSEAQELEDRFDKDRFVEWVGTIGESEMDGLEKAIDRESRRRHIRERKSRWSFFEGIEVDNSLDDGEGIESLITQLTTREASFYDTHFIFANRSLNLFHTDSIEGPLGRVKQEADSSSEAEEVFAEAVRARDEISDFYAAAAEDLAPIVGTSESAPKPRLIWFEDENHAVIEFWSLGKERTVFDGRSGSSIPYHERVLSAVRVHLEDGVLEVFDGKDTDIHRKTLIDRVSSLINDQEAKTDGGVAVAETENVLSRKIITEDVIIDIIDDVAQLVTLEGVGGDQADARLSAVGDRDVRKDRLHDMFSSRPLEIANLQMFVDDLNGRCEFVAPEEVEEAGITFDDDASRKDMKETIAEELDYDNLNHVTVSLNTENNTFRIDKERCTPSARQAVFHLATRSLDW